MPIYEYSCADCGTQFELLIRHDTEAACPQCKSIQIDKLLSLPSVKSSATHAQAMRAAKRRDRSQGMEQMAAQREYELNHED